MSGPFLRRPIIPRGIAVADLLGARYALAWAPFRLDSGRQMHSAALSLPRTLLFSRKLRVSDVEVVNHDTKRITFHLPGGNGEVSGVSPGSALLTQHYPAGSWLPVLRPYTPISDPDTVGKLQLLVKRYAKGKASSHIHNLAVGDSLTVRGPLPGYAWAPSSEERGVIFVAGGAGITPLFSLLKDALANSDDKSMIELLWGVRTKQDITLRKELTELQIRNPKRFRVTYAISRPGDGDPDPQEPDEQITHVTGRVGSQLLQKSVDRFGSYKQLGDGKGTKVFLCGPPGMEAAMMSRDGILKELGFANKDIHKF